MAQPEFLSFEDEQAPVVAFLRAEADKLGPDFTEIDTHISRIFLGGNRAWKLKRAVRLPYADFSSPEARLACCLKEVALNARTAPNLYIGVRKVTRQPDGVLRLDGSGELVDATVEMRRFGQECLFDRMAQDGRLSLPLMEDLAANIAAFHREATPMVGNVGSRNIAAVLDINRRGFSTSTVFSQAEVDELDGMFRTALDRHKLRLDQRSEAGKIRHCHGDLYLRNICMLDGQPTLFDCIEFNDTIATIDVLYDLAFLLMDLWHRGLHQHANLAANRYLDQTDDEQDLVLLPFFMALRAAVRAHVTATQVEESHGEADGLRDTARSYFDLATGLLRPVPPVFVAIGGFSGSGKSTIAELVAPRLGAPPGARILESDRIRKEIFGVPVNKRLGDEAYKPEIGDAVYGLMAARARDILSNGAAVAVDAVFNDPARQRLIADAVGELGVPFHGFWLDASPKVMRERIAGREKGPSDADIKVLEFQLSKPLEPTSWTKIEASQVAAEVAERILVALRQ
jgi:uncharacterized protein